MSIGEALARARQQSGLTVADVSRRTRIREGIIRGIEAGDFSVCGGDFYARGHIRSIAKVVGTDPVPLVAEYDQVWRDQGGSTDVTHVMDLISESRAEAPAEADTGPLDRPGTGVPGEPGAGVPGGPGTEVLGGPDTEGLDEPGPGVLGGPGAGSLTGPRTGPPGERPPGRHTPPPRERGGMPLPVIPPPREPAARPPGGPGPAPWRGPATGPRRRLNWTAVLAVAVVIAFGLIGYELLSGSGGQPTAAAPAGHSRAATRHPAEHGSGTPVPRRTSPSAAPSPTPSPPAPATTSLTPASAVAFGPGGAGQGDNGNLAHLAVDGSPGTAWHSDWYTSAHFGNLYSGTGLLLDLGHPATITGARVSLGGAPGAAFELRAGSSPSALHTVASADGVSGLVHLRLSSPVHGRYLLIWFTRLPDDAGTFEASVHDVTVTVRR